MPIPENSIIQKRIEAIEFWYHRIELPQGIVTPGWAPIAPEAYGVPESLAGKRVLDIGAWDGYWSFEALKRGAKEVVAIDDMSDLMGELPSDARREWETFDLCRELLGYDTSSCQRRTMSVYELSEQAVGRFDVVFFFGTLYHLRHPLLALDRIADICDGEIYLESAILDDFSPYQGGLHHGYGGKQMVMEFYPGTQYGENNTNWWVPSLACLVHMVGSAGFTQRCKGWKLEESPERLSRCRGFVSGSKPAQ